VPDCRKFQLADQKIRLKRQMLELARFDLDSQLQALRAGRELSVLKPLASVLQGYWEFFKSGYLLLAPLQKQVEEVVQHVRQGEADVEREAVKLRAARRQWEQRTGAVRQQSLESNAAVSSPGGPGAATAGIRDLDHSKGHAQSGGREKEGYLYVPAPNFSAVYVQLKGGSLSVQRAGDEGDVTVPVHLCTCKENRDLKLRFVFSVISPVESIVLQASSQAEMQEWLSTIQNAIQHQLNSGTQPSAKANVAADADAEEKKKILESNQIADYSTRLCVCSIAGGARQSAVCRL
jgi:hypothetical protein